MILKQTVSLLSDATQTYPLSLEDATECFVALVLSGKSFVYIRIF